MSKSKIIKKNKGKYADIKYKNNVSKLFRKKIKEELNKYKNNLEYVTEYIEPLKQKSLYSWWDCTAFKAKVF